MSKERTIEELARIYGFVPEPTEGEKRRYEPMIDSGTFDEQQLKRDILRLAEVAELTGDEITAEIALKRWNNLYPENTYSSLKLLLGVEN